MVITKDSGCNHDNASNIVFGRVKEEVSSADKVAVDVKE